MNAKAASMASVAVGGILLVVAILHVAGDGRVEVMAALMVSASILIAGGLIAWAVTASRGTGV